MLTLFEMVFDELNTEFKIVDPNYNEELLKVKIRNAINEVIDDRGYANYPEYSEDIIEHELINKFRSNITNIARYDYSLVGAFGQISHTENGVSRQFKDRQKVKGSIPRLSNII